MKIQSLLNGGFADVDDEAAKGLVDSGHWVVAGDAHAAPVRKRAVRAKVAPVDSGE